MNDIIAQAEAVLTTIERLRKYDWQDWAAVDVEDAAQIVAGVPALIARIRELEGERDGARKANREMLLEVLAASGQAQDAYQAQLAAEATVATLTAQVEAMRGALLANLTFAEKIAEAAEIDPEETALNVRVMPEGREVARRTWAEVIAQGRAALTTENQTNG